MFNTNVFSVLAPLAYQTRSTQLSNSKTPRSRSDDASVTGAGTTMLTRYASKFPFYSVYAQGIGDDNQTGMEISGNPEDNLVVKAYPLLDKEFHPCPIEIHLYKHIPSVS